MEGYPRIAGIRALVRVRRFEPAHKHANVYRCSAELAPMVGPSLLGCGQAAIGKRSKFRSMKSVRHAEQTSLRAFDCLGNSEQVRNSFVASKLAPTKSSNGGSELARDNTCSDLPLPFNQCMCDHTNKNGANCSRRSCCFGETSDHSQASALTLARRNQVRVPLPVGMPAGRPGFEA